MPRYFAAYERAFELVDLPRYTLNSLIDAGRAREAELTLDDLDLVETHDCFTIAELIEYEAMGLTERGQGAQVQRKPGDGGLGDSSATGRRSVISASCHGAPAGRARLWAAAPAAG